MKQRRRGRIDNAHVGDDATAGSSRSDAIPSDRRADCPVAAERSAPRSGVPSVAPTIQAIGAPYMAPSIGLINPAEHRDICQAIQVGSRHIQRLLDATDQMLALQERFLRGYAQQHQDAGRLGEPVAVIPLPEAEAEVVEPTASDPVAGILRRQHLIVRQGDVWEFTYAGRTVTVAHRLGFDYLRILLLHPRKYVAAAMLRGVQVESLDGPEGDAASEEIIDGALHCTERRAWSSTRPKMDDAILDKRALAEYRQAIAGLRRKRDVAVERGEIETAEALDHELEAIESELKAQASLRGRPRRFSDEDDKSRKSVREAIMACLESLADLHPALHRHLTASLKYGFQLGYFPEADDFWIE